LLLREAASASYLHILDGYILFVENAMKAVSGPLHENVLIPDLLDASPQVRPVLDRYGLRGCGGPKGPRETLGFFANAHDVPIDRLLGIIEEAVRNGKLDGGSSRQALDFFQQFADGCHHGKEEKHLFPLMEKKGFSPHHGPTSVMRQEHEMGRHLLHAMAGEIEQAEAGNKAALERFCRHAETYIQLLRKHIFKEDHRLFPMAEQVLTERDLQRLTDSFATVENADMGPGTHEKYLAIANELADRFHVPRAAVDPAAHVCCHHG
jgi:hemerythrin-like domain-containing protein